MAGLEMRVEAELAEQVALCVAAADLMDAVRNAVEQLRRVRMPPARMGEHTAAGGQRHLGPDPVVEEPVVLRIDERSGLPVLSIGRRITDHDVADALSDE